MGKCVCWCGCAGLRQKVPGVSNQHTCMGDVGMDQYLLIPFLGGWTSINPSYFDVNYRGTIGFDTLPCIAAVLDTVDRCCLQVGRRVQNHPRCRARPGEDGTVPGTQSGAEDHGRGRHPIWGPWWPWGTRLWPQMTPPFGTILAPILMKHEMNQWLFRTMESSSSPFQPGFAQRFGRGQD